MEIWHEPVNRRFSDGRSMTARQDGVRPLGSGYTPLVAFG